MAWASGSLILSLHTKFSKKFLIELGIYAVKCCKNAVKIAFFTVFYVFLFDILQH